MAGVSVNKKLLKTFTIDVTSEMDDRRYLGEFTIKRLSIADIATIGVRKAQLNGGMYFDDAAPGRGVDATTDELNAVLAHLDICVKKAPEWWNLAEISDMAVIYAVYEEVMKFENSFRGGGDTDSGTDDGSGAESGATEDTASDDVGSVRTVVGEEVQSSLEP